MLRAGVMDKLTIVQTSCCVCVEKVSTCKIFFLSQVVRSVAFSESGGIVAVGANSSTLRLCYTSQLLDPQRR